MAAVGGPTRSRVSMSVSMSLGGAAGAPQGAILAASKFVPRPSKYFQIIISNINFLSLQLHHIINHQLFHKMCNQIAQLAMVLSVLYGKFHNESIRYSILNH